jgi:hypothetical protein
MHLMPGRLSGWSDQLRRRYHPNRPGNLPAKRFVRHGCPTDALRHSRRNSAELLASTRATLSASLDGNPAVLFHDAGWAPALLQTIPGEALCFSVDSIAAIGNVGAQSTFESMWSGKVSVQWAKQHNDLWYAELFDAKSAQSEPS